MLRGLGVSAECAGLRWFLLAVRLKLRITVKDGIVEEIALLKSGYEAPTS